MTYADLLKTEEWRSKRLEILERDNNACRRCGVNYSIGFRNKTLNLIPLESTKLIKKFDFF
jgi:hypothetical protein